MLPRPGASEPRPAGFFFGFEMLVLIVVSVAALIKHGGHLSAIPFEPSRITKGASGLAAGFPLAVYLFIGWENSAALAEETGNPRRNVPRAVYLSTALMAVSYVLFAYLNPLTFFVESSTMGTILILVVYFLANLALPFYYRRYCPAEFNVVKHIVLPALGMIAIGVPVYYLVKPGQAAPYDWFPYAALAIVVVAALYGFVLNRRDPGLKDRVGSIVADE